MRLSTENFSKGRVEKHMVYTFWLCSMGGSPSLPLPERRMSLEKSVGWPKDCHGRVQTFNGRRFGKFARGGLESGHGRLPAGGGRRRRSGLHIQ
eukprot:8880769-Prorocentrum_lima.AAC.1